MFTYAYYLHPDDQTGKEQRSEGIGKDRTMPRALFQADINDNHWRYMVLPDEVSCDKNISLWKEQVALQIVSALRGRINDIFTLSELLTESIKTYSPYKKAIFGPFCELYPAWLEYQANEVRILASSMQIPREFDGTIPLFATEDECIRYMRNHLGLGNFVDRLQEEIRA